MKTAFSKSICSLASLLFALTLTLSCSNDDNTGGDGSPTGGSTDDWWQEYQERLKYYDPADPSERCQNNVVEYMCDVNGGTWYNPLISYCSEVDYEYRCDENYNCTGISTYALATIEFCGNEPYVSTNAKCVGGVLQYKCGDVWYNPDTQYCDWNELYDPTTGTEHPIVKAKQLCGGKYYEPESYVTNGVVVNNTRCQNGVVQEKCGGGWAWIDGEMVELEPVWYNRETQYCSWDNASQTQTVKSKVLCGGEYIEPDYEKCDNGVILYTCGGSMGNATWYNYITQSCVESGNWQDGYTYTVRNKVRCGS